MATLLTVENRKTRPQNNIIETGFGNWTNYGECAAGCPKKITLDAIAQLNRDYGFATIKNFFGK